MSLSRVSSWRIARSIRTDYTGSSNTNPSIPAASTWPDSPSALSLQWPLAIWPSRSEAQSPPGYSLTLHYPSVTALLAYSRCASCARWDGWLCLRRVSNWSLLDTTKKCFGSRLRFLVVDFSFFSGLEPCCKDKDFARALLVSIFGRSGALLGKSHSFKEPFYNLSFTQEHIDFDRETRFVLIGIHKNMRSQTERELLWVLGFREGARCPKIVTIVMNFF